MLKYIFYALIIIKTIILKSNLLLQQLAQPRSDDWARLVHTLSELKNNQADDDQTTRHYDSLSYSSLSSSPLR